VFQGLALLSQADTCIYLKNALVTFRGSQL
jgi:hypothetical protein